MQRRTDIGRYRHAGIFYSLSILIPWIIWFAVAYISHRYPNEYPYWTSLGCVLGLLAPLVIAMTLILPSKLLRKDLFGRLLVLFFLLAVMIGVSLGDWGPLSLRAFKLKPWMKDSGADLGV